jgi:hypothetical protein
MKILLSKLDNKLDSYYKDKADINFLEYIKKIIDEDNDNKYRLNKFLCVQGSLGYKENENEFNERCNSLISRNYLTELRSLLGITEEGRAYLIDYYRYQKLGILSKFTKIFKQKISALLDVFAIVISIISIILSIVAIFHK